MSFCKLASSTYSAFSQLRSNRLHPGYSCRMGSIKTSCPTRYDFASSPYRVNNVLNIRKHLPPNTVNSKYAYVDMPDPKYNELLRERELPLEERYHRHPPTETEPLAAKEVPLKIIRHLRAGDAKAAQLVLAKVDDSISKVPLVAKFYDPFYFDHVQDDVDPFLTVDYEYARETSAYQYLNNEGSETPFYYGSFSCNFPMSNGSRAVRLILIEYVKGVCMDTLDPASLSQIARQNIMESVVRAESYLFARRFNHDDVFPRNVIIQSKTTQGFEDRGLRVKLIDFSTSKFGWEIRKPEMHAAISPIMRWHKNGSRNEPFLLTGWIDWDWQTWLERCFKDDPNFLPITDEQKRPWLAY